MDMQRVSCEVRTVFFKHYLEEIGVSKIYLLNLSNLQTPGVMKLPTHITDSW
jgi:hypothetical protein